MSTYSFDYARAGSVDEALSLLAEHGPDAKLLAGGHSLIPAMKLRLSAPAALIDISGLTDLAGIRAEGNQLHIGAMTTHRTVEHSDLLKKKCSVLPEIASGIGDPMVRNKGTIGGSLAHADPAADYPAVVLALDAEMEIAGSGGQRRTVASDDFFQFMFETAVGEGELLTKVTFPVMDGRQGAAYAKFENPASRYAVVGVAAWVKLQGTTCEAARIAVTGAAATAFRATDAEDRLVGSDLSDDAIADAVRGLANADDLMSDLSGSAEYRAHLCEVMAKKALRRAADRAQRN